MKAVAVAVVLAFQLAAQTHLAVTDKSSLNNLFDHTVGEQLDCTVQVPPVSLDFELRYEVRFILRCPLQPFAGEATQLHAILRITPETGSPVFFGDRVQIPAMPKAVALPSQTLQTAKNGLEFSGGFAVGVGRYTVELLVFDPHRFVFRYSWQANAFSRGNEKKADFPLKPGEVAALNSIIDDPSSAMPDEPTLHLTVALKAAPMDRHDLELRAWDRAFLMSALDSLLRTFPSASVRLVVFNLSLGVAAYEKPQFKQSMLPELSATLQSFELGKVDYRAIQHPQRWAELLTDMIAAASVSDAIILLGPEGTPGLKVATA
jgi:hypothetical protein